MLSEITIEIDPVPAVRMTQKSKWTKDAKKYLAFKEELLWRCKEKKFYIPNLEEDIINHVNLDFNLAMPKGWSQKKKAGLLGMPHRQTPDLDNLVKAVLDALFKNDSHIASIDSTKDWDNYSWIYIGISYRKKNV